MFFSRKSPAIDILKGLVDCHSHILPGVDDGIRTDADALEVLSDFESRGVQRLTMSPHIMESYPKNTAGYLRGEFERFSELYSGPIELSLGAEYMVDAEFMDHISSGDVLTLKDNYILIETSYMGAMINLEDVIAELMNKGYFVVLAHPERYLYMNNQEYKSLKDRGVLFQMNILSIFGGYGRRVQSRAKMLLEQNSYNILGSDIHNLDSFSGLMLDSRIETKYMKLLEKLKLGLE